MVCNKTKYLNKEQADLEVKRLKKISIRDVVPVRSYLCDFCGTWHITSKDDKRDILILQLRKRVSDQKDQINILNQRLNIKNEEIKKMKSKLNFRGDIPNNLPLEIKSKNIEKFNKRYKK